MQKAKKLSSANFTDILMWPCIQLARGRRARGDANS